jgi:hypothetical protein
VASDRGVISRARGDGRIQVTGGPLARGDFAQERPFLGAGREAILAAGVKRATGGQVRGVGDFALHAEVHLFVRIGLRYRRDKFFGVGMCRSVENLFGRRQFDEASQIGRASCRERVYTSV